jgi:hypothetical protein
MSKFRFILIAAALALLATLMLVTCGDDSSSSNEASFKPGTYTGILTITEHKESPNEFSLSDTLMFNFYQGDSFRVDTLQGDTDILFCPIKGKYTYTRDSLKIHTITLTRPEVCNRLDTVDANFRLLDTDHGWLIYTTSDTALYRQLEIKAQ